MPLFQSETSRSPFRSGPWFRKGLNFVCGLAVLSAQGVSLAGDDVAQPPVNPLVQTAKLRMEARLAAEQGDFRKAAEILEDAALVVGDRETAARAQQAGSQLQAGGGSQADFTQLMLLIREQTAPPALWVENGDEIGTMTPFIQGVFVGVPAVFGAMSIATDDSRLMNAAELARTANRNDDVREASGLRLVSLPRLEQHVKSLIDAGKEVPEDVACLAGLTEVRFLFVYPETGDVVIGGPAGDWKIDENGRTIGLNDNRPTLKLDDLVTLSRTFSSGGTGFFMCSIDPKPEQVKAVKQLAAQNNQLSAGNVRKFTEKLEEMLGLQNVIVQGVPEDSRVASVIVDADYQMKRIGIGEREGSVGMKSYFDLVSREERRGSAMDALRWWMTVGYDAIQVAPNHQAFEFSGQAVQCQSENQLVGNDGSRQTTGKADKANSEFARLFTENLPELAEQDVVFADLQNVFDVALVTALMHSHGLNRLAGWKPELFAVDGSYVTASVDVPDELMTAANSRVYRGGDIMIQVAGGIRGDLRSVVQNPENFENSEEVNQMSDDASPVGQPGRWWWDAAAR